MKIQFINNGFETLQINDSILTQNGVEWDLDNLETFVENEKNTLAHPDWYKDSEDIIHGIISVDQKFLISGNKFIGADGNEYICYNYILYFDKDLNDDISVEELATFINFINKPEEFRRAFILERTKELIGDKYMAYGFDKTGFKLSKLSESDRIDFLMNGIVK